MAEKDDHENLGDDLSQQQHQSLLELSSALQDRVPSPGIGFVGMIQTNDAITTSSNIMFSFLLLTVSAPPEIGPANEEVSESTKIGLCTPHTCVGCHNHTFRNLFFPGPLKISFLRKAPNEACCH